MFLSPCRPISCIVFCTLAKKASEFKIVSAIKIIIIALIPGVGSNYNVEQAPAIVHDT